MVVAPSPNSKH